MAKRNMMFDLVETELVTRFLELPIEDKNADKLCKLAHEIGDMEAERREKDYEHPQALVNDIARASVKVSDLVEYLEADMTEEELAMAEKIAKGEDPEEQMTDKEIIDAYSDDLSLILHLSQALFLGFCKRYGVKDVDRFLEITGKVFANAQEHFDFEGVVKEEGGFDAFVDDMPMWMDKLLKHYISDLIED